MYDSYKSACGCKSLNAKAHCASTKRLGHRECANFLKDLNSMLRDKAPEIAVIVLSFAKSER